MRWLRRRRAGRRENDLVRSPLRFRLKAFITDSAKTLLTVIKLLPSAPLDPADAAGRLGAARSLLLLAVLFAIQLSTIAAVVFSDPERVAAAQVTAYIKQGITLPEARFQAATGLRDAGWHAVAEVTRSFAVELTAFWLLLSGIGLVVGVRCRNRDTSVLAAIAIGQTIFTLAFVLRYGTLALAGIQTGDITIASLGAMAGVEMSPWARRFGPFHIWWSWAVGVALARHWSAPPWLIVALTVLSMALWRLHILRLH